MNKYESISRKLKRKRQREKGCRNKVAYPTREAASKRGQDVYRCPYGAHYHRSGAAATLAATLANRKRKPCNDCPWVRKDRAHLLDKVEGVREAALAGKVFMCHAIGGHPPCTGVAVWRKQQRKPKVLQRLPDGGRVTVV